MQIKCDKSTDDCSTHDDDNAAEDPDGLSSLQVEVDSLTLASACRCIDPTSSCTCNNAALGEAKLELSLETDVPAKQRASLPEPDKAVRTSSQGSPPKDTRHYKWTTCSGVTM